MVIRKTTAKLDDYLDRLGHPEAKRVQPSHVARILAKLRSKEADLLDEIAGTDNTNRAERLRAKLTIVREQIRRGVFLMDRLSEAEANQGDT